VVLNYDVAPGSLSGRVVKKESMAATNKYMLLYVAIRYSLLMLQDASL
jgi:hypothetical protein